MRFLAVGCVLVTIVSADEQSTATKRQVMELNALAIGAVRAGMNAGVRFSYTIGE